MRLNLPAVATTSSLYQDFLAALAESGFNGDVARDYATRLTLATDNSAFQQLPEAGVFPRDADDIERLLGLAGEPRFAGVRLAPRGGGTSTIGCALTAGLVLDCSRHMNAIINIDTHERTVRVEPGVVLDQLNEALAEHGLFFAPHVAPSSRATLGGMANTDGCGKGSRVYGKTSDHVRAAELILVDGTRFRAAPVDRDELAVLRARDDGVGRIHAEVADVIAANGDEIARVFPDLARYLSGYNLAQVWDAAGEVFNLNKLICGSEGTLAVVAELTLNVVPIPATRTLFALRYDSFDDALRDAERLVEFEPSAIESLDDTVMGLARDNPIYDCVRDFIENEDGSTPRAVNLVEFAAPPGADLADRLVPFRAFLGGAETTRARGFYEADSAAAQTALWDLRKGGVGLLGATRGDRKPLPFVEDTVVDPRHLADYVRDFRAILDEYGLEYGMFGHIDVGCLHVRPALDLTDPDDERIMREVMDRVEVLVRGYGGLVWNEHGKGFRSQYNPDYFGPRLYGALQRIKTAFDPHNQLNPGKVVVPADDATSLAAMDAPTRGTFDRQISKPVRVDFDRALACNGNGACFNHDPFDVMCPSYRATRDRLHSPKGRAAAMREWLRQMAINGDDNPMAHHVGAPSVGALLTDALRPSRRAPDFSDEVWHAMDGCLSCRACADQCPIKVNVPDFKSRFLARYHAERARPLGDYALAWLEPVAARAARWPRSINRLARSASVRRLVERVFGLSDLPSFSEAPLHRWLKDHPAFVFDADRLAAMTGPERARAVGVVPDAFTGFFDADTLKAALELLAGLGFIPLLLPFKPSGKALHVKGFLDAFDHRARNTAAGLAQYAAWGLPLVGIEPSVTLAFRHEYRDRLGASAVPDVRLIEEFLAETAWPVPPATRVAGQRFRLLGHCTATSSCPASARAWQTVFERFGATLSIARVGCCGMSGAYGHETRHRATSQRIFELSWAPSLRDDEGSAEVALAPGYSCRSQSRRFGDMALAHPATALRGLLLR